MIHASNTHAWTGQKHILFALSILAIQYTYLFVTVDFSTSGANSYGVIAKHLYESHTYSLDGEYPTFSRPPLYPLLLAVARMVSVSEWPLIAMSVQALLGLGSLLLVYKISQTVFAEQTTSHLAILLYALHLTLHKEQLIQRETALFEFLILAFVFFLVRANAPFNRIITTSILAALAFLTRPTGFWLFPILLSYVLFYPGFYVKEKIKLGVISLIVFELVLLPWQIYHFVNFGGFSFATSSNGGVNIFKGNSRLLGDIYPAIDVDHADEFIDFLLEEHKLVSERDRNQFLTEQGLADVVADPGGFVQRFVQKSIYFFSPIEIPFGRGEVAMGSEGRLIVENFRVGFGIRNFAHFFISIIIVPLGFIGLLQAIKSKGIQRTWGLVSVAIILSTMFTYALFFVLLRYRLPLDGLFCIAAAFVLAKIRMSPLPAASDIPKGS